MTRNDSEGQLTSSMAQRNLKGNPVAAGERGGGGTHSPLAQLSLCNLVCNLAGPRAAAGGGPRPSRQGDPSPLAGGLWPAGL